MGRHTHKHHTTHAHTHTHTPHPHTHTHTNTTPHRHTQIQTPHHTHTHTHKHKHTLPFRKNNLGVLFIWLSLMIYLKRQMKTLKTTTSSPTSQDFRGEGNWISGKLEASGQPRPAPEAGAIQVSSPPLYCFKMFSFSEYPARKLFKVTHV